MNKIEVAVLHEAHECPAGMMMFLAKLTQRGHSVQNMEGLRQLYDDSIGKHKTAEQVAKLPHGTIKRFSPITVAIVGASRRFLAQARTHQVGINYVSASLQYSDYSGKADFVVPYELLDKPECDSYLALCTNNMEYYKYLVSHGIDNDTAGYAAPQGLRNILVMQGNHEAWLNFIRVRSCHRNTVETQYVTMRIWEELLKTADGQEMFAYAGPDCAFGQCREGRMSCGKPMRGLLYTANTTDKSAPRVIIESLWPLLK